MEWYLKVLNNYVGFQGRARRKEYWMFVLFNIIAGFVLGIVGAILNTNVISGLYSLALFLPSLAVSFRRLHDTGRSGWFMLLGLIPFVGAIILIVFFCQEGDDRMNNYGPNPKAGF